MDLAIRFPDQGRIHLESRFLFAEPRELNSIALKQANVSISLRGASSIATDTAHIAFLEKGSPRSATFAPSPVTWTGMCDEAGD